MCECASVRVQVFAGTKVVDWVVVVVDDGGSVLGSWTRGAGVPLNRSEGHLDPIQWWFIARSGLTPRLTDPSITKAYEAKWAGIVCCIVCWCERGLYI